MISKILKFIYKYTPGSLTKALGKSQILGPFRNFLLNQGDSKRLLTVTANWGNKFFLYKGDFKSAIKAERKGIENSLLRLSIKLLREVKKKGDDSIVLDVGSAYGYLSTVWALSVSANGKVYAFEANESVYKAACDTALKNSLTDRIMYNHLAVFSTDGVVEMNMHDGTHASLSDIGNNRQTVKAVKIDTFCIDNMLSRVDLIKVDVDGPEWEVLQGAVYIIQRDKPILIVESNNDQRIVTWLVSQGYEIFDLNMKRNESDYPPPNIVAIPKQ